MESLNTYVGTAAEWLDNHWLLILAAYPIIVGTLRIIVKLIRKHYKPEEGTRLDGFCDVIEGLMFRGDAILAGLDKMRKGQVVEGVVAILNSEGPPSDEDNTPTLRPLHLPG